MEMINCEIYHCRMTAAACASRHLNSMAMGPSAVGNHRVGQDDPNCKPCREGMARAKALGIKGVAAYRAYLSGIRKNAAKAAGKPKAALPKKEGTPMEETATQEAAQPAPTLETPVKTCKRCGETKPLEAFHINKLCRGGVENRCKICRSSMARERRLVGKSAGAEADDPAPTRGDYAAGHGDFARLESLLSGRRYTHSQLTEIRALCERIGDAIETYLTFHEMFTGG